MSQMSRFVTMAIRDQHFNEAFRLSRWSAIRLMPMGRHTQRIDSMECRESVPYRATRNPEATNGSVRQLDCKSKVIEIDEDNDDENGGKYAKDFRTFLLTHPELVGPPRIDLPIETPRLHAHKHSRENSAKYRTIFLIE